MIIVPNSDSHIWDVSTLIDAIVGAMSNNQDVDICLNNEGPCGQSLGLYDILDALCEKHDYTHSRIHIHTCNQLEYHPRYDIQISSPLHLVTTAQNFYNHNDLQMDKIFNSDHKHFAILIGRSNWVRLWLTSALDQRYADKSLISFHWQRRHEFHDANVGLDNMLRWNCEINDVTRATNFLQTCPRIIETINVYPIVSPANLSICELYDQFFTEIVCETYFSGQSFFPTEKTWRPMLMKTPFIIHGPVDYLRNLRRLGFRTFSQWWNEEYDDYGHDNRARKILKLCDDIQKLSLVDLESMYNDMMPTLMHNHQIFMDLKLTNFKQTFNYV